MNHIENQWQIFKKTIQTTVPKSEVDAMKISFFAGATSIYHVMMTKAQDDSVSVKEGEGFLAEIHMEINHFLDAISELEEPACE